MKSVNMQFKEWLEVNESKKQGFDWDGMTQTVKVGSMLAAPFLGAIANMDYFHPERHPQPPPAITRSVEEPPKHPLVGKHIVCPTWQNMPGKIVDVDESEAKALVKSDNTGADHWIEIRYLVPSESIPRHYWNR